MRSWTRWVVLLAVCLLATQVTGANAGIDGSGFTSSSTRVEPMGALHATTPPSIGENRVGAVRMDSQRRLIINCESGCGGSGGTSQADRTTFTDGSGSLTPIGGVLNDSAPSDPLEDQAAAARITPKRALHVNLRDAAGNEVTVGGGTQYDEDTAHASGDKLTLAGAVRRDTATSGTDANGDRATLNVDASGRLWVNGSDVTQPVSASSLPLPTGAATETTLGSINTKTPALVSGRVPVDGSGVTQPVSGTVTANAGTGTFTVGGTVTANAGTGTFTNQQSNVTTDYDTGAGTQTMTMFGLGLPGSGGAVAGGTSTNPIRTDPTGTTTQPVSGTVTANAGTGTFTVGGTVTSNQGTAAAGSGAWPVMVTDTANTTVKPGDATNNAVRVNIVAGGGSGGTSTTDNSTFTGGSTAVTPMGALFDATPPAITDGNIGAPRMDSSRRLLINCESGCGGSGGTASNFDAAFPAQGTAAGFSDGTNMRAGRVFDVDSGAGAQYVQGISLRKSASGGSVELGTATDPVRTDPTGTTTQPVSGTVTANQGGSWTVSQSGTWTVQPGNTENTTPWRMKPHDGTNPIFGAATALADTTGNPTVGGVATFNMCFNGTTWDRCKPSAIDTDDGSVAGGQASVALTVGQRYEFDGTNWLRPPVHGATDDAGAPYKLGARGVTGLSGQTAVTSGQMTRLYAGRDGAIVVRPDATLEDKVAGSAAITDGASTSVIAAQGAGIKTCIKSVIISNTSATNVTVDIRDGTAGAILAGLQALPVPKDFGGVVLNLPVPVCGTANTAIAADPSAAATTVTVNIIGFKSAI